MKNITYLQPRKAINFSKTHKHIQSWHMKLENLAQNCWFSQLHIETKLYLTLTLMTSYSNN